MVGRSCRSAQTGPKKTRRDRSSGNRITETIQSASLLPGGEGQDEGERKTNSLLRLWNHPRWTSLKTNLAARPPIGAKEDSPAVARRPISVPSGPSKIARRFNAGNHQTGKSPIGTTESEPACTALF